MFVEELVAESNRLHVLKKQAEDCVNKAPEGTLRISCSGRHLSYYQRFCKGGSGMYIPRNNWGLVKRLAQKDYAKKMLREIEREKRAIDRLIESYGGGITPTGEAFFPKDEGGSSAMVDPLAAIYTDLSAERKALVVPYVSPDEP